MMIVDAALGLDHADLARNGDAARPFEKRKSSSGLCKSIGRPVGKQCHVVAASMSFSISTTVSS